jgi:hypothetical protein
MMTERKGAWSDGEIAVLREEFDRGHEIPELPAILARRCPDAPPRSQKAVRKRLVVLGLQRLSRFYWSPEADNILEQGWASGRPFSHIVADIKLKTGRDVSIGAAKKRVNRLQYERRVGTSEQRRSAREKVSMSKPDSSPLAPPSRIEKILAADRLIDWLKAQGHEVRVNPNSGDPLGAWIFDGVKMPLSRLVLEGNRRRVAAGEAAVIVPGVAL